MTSEYGLELADAVWTSESEWGSVATRPEPRPVGHDEQGLSAGRKRPGAFVQQARGILACLQPMQQHQSVRLTVGKRPERLFAQDARVSPIAGPGHDPLRCRHQADNARRPVEIPVQEGCRETEPHDRLSIQIGPELTNPGTDRPFRRAAQSRSVVKVSEFKDVEMHCYRPPDRQQSGSNITCTEGNSMPLDIVTVPCLADNYAFLVHSSRTGGTALVDAPEAAPVRQALADRGWSLSHILITHHHSDHIDAVAPLREEFDVRVVGAAADAERLPRLDLAVAEGDVFEFSGYEVRVLDVSGHTVGHIAFHVPERGVVFTADSLMALGCGRLFEGSADQMWASLSKLAALPPETLVCSGHEYTVANARFALTVEPDNPDLRRRAAAIEDARERGEPTVPSTLAEEMATNPFLRAGLPEVKALMGMSEMSDAAVFAEIRRRKDRF